MNLRDEFLPFKEVIGEVILDKNPHIKTVVTKVGMLSNEFRTFQMGIISSRDGCKSLVASVNERKMKLMVDYENCYWNSRLATERERLLKAFHQLFNKIATVILQAAVWDITALFVFIWFVDFELYIMLICFSFVKQTVFVWFHIFKIIKSRIMS
jgi:hypothetical protein